MIEDHDSPLGRWERVERLYWLVLDHPHAERARALADACGTDRDLQREVESLLAAHDAAPDFLATSALDVAATLIETPDDADLVGRRIGPYDVTGWLGAGGMGDVYRAHDARLDRDVALKVLPPLFVEDPRRRDAFAREAQVLASLNHPNIGAIYGLEQSGAVHALVLELVEGPTLAAGLAAGRLPLDEAIAIARQIAAGLEAAHERGIVHRDLKPSNIAVSHDGVVKLLDFGIAAALRTDTANDTPPVIGGGTPAYASPEQRKGHAIDKRSDIWAFGAVFYEMVSSRRAVHPSVDRSIDSTSAGGVDWNALPSSTPPAVRQLLRRCLEPDPRRRLRDIGEARIALEEPTAALAVSAEPVAPGLLFTAAHVALPALALVLLGTMTLWYWRREPGASGPVTRFTHTLPSGESVDLPASRHVLAMSPDGRRLAYLANHRIHVRSLDDISDRPIAGIDFEDGVSEPVFSPDGRSLAFWVPTDGTIKRVDLAGGAAVTLSRADNPYGMTWGPAGILAGHGAQGIWRIRGEGAAPEQLIRVKDGEEAHQPQLLPGGEHVLFTLAHGTAWGRWSQAQVVVQSLTSGQRTVLVNGGTDARYVPSGHLLYTRDATLFAVPFDAARLELTGAAVAVVEGIRQGSNRETGASQYSISDTGTLSYLPGPVVGSEWGPQELLIADRTGRATPLKVPPGPYRAIRVSPDGTRIAIGADDGRDGRIYTYQLSGTSPMQRLTFDGHSSAPVWTPDGIFVTFQSDRGGDGGIFWQRADGTGRAERLTHADDGESQTPESWSPDGRWLLFSRARGADVRLWVLSRDDRQIAPFGDVRSIFPLDARFSPDGRWVTYSQRNRTGRSAILVQPFPATGAKYEVPVAGAAATPHKAIWSPDGRRLMYVPRLGGFEAVSVTTRPAFSFGDATPIPRPFGPGAPSVRALYDVMPDGRFVGMRPIGDLRPVYQAGEIHIVLNWFEELNARVQPSP